MTGRFIILLLAFSSACGTTWDSIDADGDGYSRQDGDCWDASVGPEGSGLTGADIHPEATEGWYDGVDQDCGGDDDYDQDGDGWILAEYEGLATLGIIGSGDLPSGDCWDALDDQPSDYTVVSSSFTDRQGRYLDWDQPGAADTYPGASDTWYDGVDQDCAGDDDFDQDGDGYASEAYPNRGGVFGDDCIDGTDIDDDNPAGSAAPDVHPDAPETWYDGTDQDCDDNDCDQDGDGYDVDGLGLGFCDVEECDDSDASINPDPHTEEVWYNGIDEDCDGDDGDQDDDGFWAEDYEQLVLAAGGEPLDVPVGYEGDCDDDDGSVNPGANETWYDGTDQDCDGSNDYDQDDDGYELDLYGGEDCDDENAAVHPASEETWYDGIDQDCDGIDDDDDEFDGYENDHYKIESWEDRDK